MSDQPAGTEVPVYASAAATALLTIPSWLKLTGAGLGGGELAEGLAEMQRAMQAMMGSFSLSVSGLDTGPGILGLVGALLCGVLTWAEVTKVVPWDRGTTRLLATLAAALAAGSTLYAMFSYRGMSATFWLVLAMVAAGAMAWFSFQRLRALAEPQSPPQATA